MRKSVVVGYGFLGRHLADALVARGDEVLVIEKRDVPLPDGAVKGDARYIDGPIECNDIYHLAGLTNYAYCEANPFECIESNVMSTVNMIRRMKPQGKFVLASSAAVYVPNDVPLSESHPTGPRSIYGASKHAAEGFVQAKCDRWLIARFFNVYGPGQSRSFIVPQMIHQARREGIISIRNRGTFRDYLYVYDAIKALLLAAEAPTNFVVNIGSGKKTSTGEIAEIVGREMEVDVRSKEVYDSYSPRTLCADTSRIRALGWSPEFSLEEGLDATIVQS